MKAVSFLGLLSLACISASLTDNLVILYPGYIVNYETPKDKTDTDFAFIPITSVGPETNYLTTIKLGLAIDAAVGALPPEEKIWISLRSLPLFTSSPNYVLSQDGQTTTIANQSNGFYWIGAQANCQNQPVSTCKNSVEAEVSLWTLNGTAHWPPYQILDQRRTAKFDIGYQKYLYFWLTVTDSNLDANGIFNLYLGVQFWQDGDDSAVQMSYWLPTAPWPTLGVNVTSAEDYFPLSATQRNDWIMSSPWPIKVGVWKVAAQNTVNNPAKFTVKAGFNKPPVQAANLNASFNHIGFLTLITLCIMKHLFF